MILLILTTLCVIGACALYNRRMNYSQARLRSEMAASCSDIENDIELMQKCMLPEQHRVELEMLRLAGQTLNQAKALLHAPERLQRSSVELLVNQAHMLAYHAREHALQDTRQEQATSAISLAEQHTSKAYNPTAAQNLMTAKRCLAEGNYQTATWHAQQASRSAIRQQAQECIGSMEKYLRSMRGE